jgi:hypothetical protein
MRRGYGAKNMERMQVNAVVIMSMQNRQKENSALWGDNMQSTALACLAAFNSPHREKSNYCRKVRFDLSECLIG